MEISFSLLHIPFKVAFKHNSATRSESSTFWVEIQEEGFIGCGEGCPRVYVTGETEETCVSFFNQWKESWKTISGLQSLERWAEDHQLEIDSNLSAWCAVEMAFLDLWSQQSEMSIPQFLGYACAEGEAVYSAVLGDASEETWKKLCDWHLQNEMCHFKLKVNGDIAIDSARVAYIKEKCPQADIRLDANNIWKDASEAVQFLSCLPQQILAIEEPLIVPNWEGLCEMIPNISMDIILDEHACLMRDLRQVKYPQRMIFNLRVSKCGGILRSIEMGRMALQMGMKVIIGAQVGESSALTRAGLMVAHALGGKVLAFEGGYGLNLMERDFFRETYQFGRGGIMRFSF
jgi:L-alanine-DL-glutamate epimerase-like enolase superfamily enzyme